MVWCSLFDEGNEAKPDNTNKRGDRGKRELLLDGVFNDWPSMISPPIAGGGVTVKTDRN
jgi:hypothetical protein